MSLIAILIASLIGSAHCVSMCGGFVAFYSVRSKKEFLPHLSYHLGRLITYVSLGALAGYFGKALDSGGALLGIQRAAAILLGLVMIIWGISKLIRPNSGQLFAILIHKIFGRLSSSVMKWADKSPPVLLALALGLITTFLPCGWLYTFVAVAAASADPLRGILVMISFWLGTVPALASLGAIGNLLGVKFTRFIPRITAALLVAAGVFSILDHVDPFSTVQEKHHHSHH